MKENNYGYETVKTVYIAMIRIEGRNEPTGVFNTHQEAFENAEYHLREWFFCADWHPADSAKFMKDGDERFAFYVVTQLMYEN